MKFYYNGTDIYNDVSVNYCVYEMLAEKRADTLVIRCNDAKGVWSKWNATDGDEVRFVEGSGDTGRMFVHFMCSENGWYTIRAMSMPKSGTTKKSQSWEGKRFLQIAQEVAGNHGLSFQNYGCTDQVYPYLTQENETDFSLFSRLCMLEGCQMLLYDGRLVAYDERYLESQAPTGKLEVGENGNFTYRDNRSACYGSCEIASGSFFGRFTAPNAQSTSILRPDRTIRVASNVEAARFARGLLRNANKYGRRGKFTKALLPGYAAASLLHLRTPKASAWDGPVFVYKIRHDFVRNQSTVYFRDLLEGY